MNTVQKLFCDNPKVSIETLSSFLERDKVKGFGKLLYLGKDSYIKEMYKDSNLGQYLIEFDSGYMVKYSCPPEKMYDLINIKKTNKSTPTDKVISKIYARSRKYVSSHTKEIKDTILNYSSEQIEPNLVVLRGWSSSIGVPREDILK
jgi:hypothetical protein